MNKEKTINPLKGIEEQVDKILFPKEKKIKSEFITYSNNTLLSLKDVKKQLLDLVKELRANNINNLVA